MAKGIFSFIFVATFAAASQAAVIPPEGNVVFTGNPLHYIGSVKSLVPRVGKGGASVFQESFYFVSQNAAAWSNSDKDCKAFLSENATLAYIETEEELGNVTRFFAENDDTVSRVWIGGLYDTNKVKFAWGNGAEVGPWAPWAPGHPNTRTAVTKICATTVGGIRFETEFQTKSYRYLCELKSALDEEEAVPCYDDNDLVIVVDSSGSIGQVNYMAALEFTTKLAIAWADNPGNRASVVVYSSSVHSIFGLANQLSVPQIRDKVYNSPYFGGSTNSHLGLNEAVQEIGRNPKAVPKNIVFLTDGGSSNPSETLAAAQRVQAAGIRSFAVGITQSVNQAELLAIAGGNRDHVFNTDGFDDLLKLLQPVSRRVCNN